MTLLLRTHAAVVTVLACAWLAAAAAAPAHVAARLALVFGAAAVVLNLALWALVVRPVARLARDAEHLSLGEADAPALAVHGRGELARLARALTRLRRSLSRATRLLDETR